MSDVMSPKDRQEWSDLLSAALNGSRRVDTAAVDRAEKALSAFPFWRIITRQYVRAGLRKALNDISKTESISMVSYNGALIAKTTRKGVRRRLADGSLEHQQVLWHELSWVELEQWLSTITGQLSAALVNQDSARRLLTLRDDFPESYGPGEACTALGTTVEAFLAM